MLDALQAQSDKLSRHAQTLFELPAIAWLECIQQEIANPAVMLEQLLNEILGQHQENETHYSRATERLAQAHQAAPTTSHYRLTQPLSRVSRARFEEATEKAFLPRQRAHSSTSVQRRIPLAGSELANAQVTRGTGASTKHSTSFTNTSSSQCTRLLAEIGDLQNLLQTVAQEQTTHSSPPAAAHHQPTTKATATINADHPNWSDDLPSTEALPNATHNETTKDLRWHETSPNSLSPGSRQYTQPEMQGDQDQASLSTSKPLASRALTQHAENSAVTATILTNPATNNAPASITPPDPRLPSTHSSPPAHVRLAHNEVATYAQTLSALTTLDSAAQDLLLDQLLDRFEERQRENALRSLGFTGGQI